ncbi:MAG TPA: LysR family transcriptional regulator [Polyangiaceae bacterium]|nr:LysR family transcriptional regulator [Polyangiaceae bacterium]
MRDAERSLARLDLNLLVTLDALLAERNVTRAARRLGVSQPAVSMQLAKLRQALQDPLLVPGPRGMAPTSLAAALEGPLRGALQQLVQVIAPARPFDPARAELTWRLAASDYAACAIVQPLLPGLRRSAPGARLAVLPVAAPRVARQAENAEIDLGFLTLDIAPPGLRCRPLFTERYLLAGRADHPALRRRPTLAQFCRLEFAIVSPNGGGFRGTADTLLETMGLKRQVVLSVPHFLFLLSAVTHSDLVALVPSRLAAGAPGLRVVEAPLDVPGFEMAMVWHERVHRDPAHVWLRELVVDSLPPRS